MKVDVLDHGFVELVDSLGSDLTVVNSARVSFGKRRTELSASDENLILYLAKHKHYSPFRHVQLQFHCKVPEFVARQWYKHVVGIAYSEGPVNDHAWNEISMRYVDMRMSDFYEPKTFRKQAVDNKQASTDEVVERLDNGQYISECIGAHVKMSLDLYDEMIEAGVAKEQARMVLPLNTYTEFYWTASLQAVANFIQLREHSGSQYEIRLYADAIKQLTRTVVPVALEALSHDND